MPCAVTMHHTKMPFVPYPCKSLCFSRCTVPIKDINVFSNTIRHPSPKPQIFCSFATNLHTNPPTTSVFYKKFSILSATHLAFCSRNAEFDGFSSNQLSQETLDGRIQEHGKLELLNKPSPVAVKNGSSSEVNTDPEKHFREDEGLTPFMKFFKGSDSVGEVEEDGGVLGVSEENDDASDENEGAEKVSVGYYEPKPGDFVVGVVVSGNENRLNVNVGAELLGTMLTKEVLPLYSKEMEYLLCDMNKGGENFMFQGRMRIVKNDDAIGGVPVPGGPVVEIGTILFAEVLGRTLTGRPLLSTRRLFRRIALHRVKQIKQLDEPIEVRITEWNTGGLLTRIEGLRAFLPKTELMKRVNSYTELKENVGCCMHVRIIQIDDAKNSLVLSEKEAWGKLNLQEGTLLDGTVKQIFPYGAQIRIGETNRSGLLHVSNITRAEISSVSDILSVDEKVKVLVVKSGSPDKISLSIADLESEPGLFLSDKERVFLEADMMAKKYKKKLTPALTTQRSKPLTTSALPFENETLYANWKWFKFEK